MDKGTLQQHIDNFKTMIADMGDDDTLRIKLKNSAGLYTCLDLKNDQSIIEVELTKREVITIES